jgi:predicted DNA-binding transcriptional regulator AlpA
MHTTNTPSEKPETLLGIQDLCRLFGCTPGTIRNWVRKGNFPVPVRFSARIARWRREEVQAFLESKKQQSLGWASS